VGVASGRFIDETLFELRARQDPVYYVMDNQDSLVAGLQPGIADRLQTTALLC